MTKNGRFYGSNYETFHIIKKCHLCLISLKMSCQKHKINSYSMRGCHYSRTASIEGDISKTGQKILIGKGV